MGENSQVEDKKEEEIEVIDLTKPEETTPEKPVKPPEHTEAEISQKKEPEITCPRCDSKEEFDGLGLYKCNKCGMTFEVEE